jgi:hypothetical protein
MNTSKFLTEHEAASYLRLSPKTLSKWRLIKTGPAFHRFGSAVRYSLSDLEDFAATGEVNR